MAAALEDIVASLRFSFDSPLEQLVIYIVEIARLKRNSLEFLANQIASLKAEVASFSMKLVGI